MYLNGDSDVLGKDLPLIRPSRGPMRISAALIGRGQIMKLLFDNT